MLSAPLSLLPAVKSTSAGDAHKVCFHLFSFWLVRKAQNWRGQCVCVCMGGVCAGDRKDPLQRHAQPALGTAALEALRFPAAIQSPVFCGRAANDTIKFIRRTSVVNDQTTGCPLGEAGLKQLKNQEPGASKPSLQILSAISKLNHQYPWRVCRHLRTEVCSCHSL